MNRPTVNSAVFAWPDAETHFPDRTQYLPPERILPFDCKDNFWEMGDQGPCGEMFDTLQSHVLTEIQHLYIRVNRQNNNSKFRDKP